ncbi:MAG: hypothetical protein ACD_73C00534G0002 [uncultured bacterium]|nr:MAG: hypothetical protein ACD_73C00534G0002 [uncultured bacterium]
MEDIRKIFDKQKTNRWNISQTTATERIAKLRKIKEAIFAKRGELQEAIYNDYKKNPAETDLTEIYPTVAEIEHSIKHLKKWMKPHKVKTPLTLFGTCSAVHYEAKGVVLILSPWNYPFQLLMSPLVAAISAGNCAIIKPSSKTPHTSHFLKKMISELFPEEEIALIEGSAQVADELLEFPFDHVFFTGSPKVGKHVMSLAAKNLAPVTLELGGKSPVILDETADVVKAAQRIMWGKFINAGQTCVAPDYLLIHESRAPLFIEESKKVIAARYGDTEQAQAESPHFCRLVSDGHLESLKKILDESIKGGAKMECGGKTSQDPRYLSPTLLSGVTNDSAIMREEIFGPILPILAYKNLDEAIRIIQAREKPLALYIFSKNKKNIQDILSQTTAGGTCINSLIIHLANCDLPFGGVGNSGMGNYHGFYGFKTLSHERAVLRQSALDTLKFFYPPYTAGVKKMIWLATKYLS